MSLAEPRTLLERLIAEGAHTWQEIETRFDRRAEARGERVSLTWRHLQRIAAGEVGRPRPVVARVLADLFDHDTDELLGPPSGAGSNEVTEDGEAVRRREFLAGVAAASIGVASPESFSRLVDGLTAGRPRRVGCRTSPRSRRQPRST